ncbi:MAG TPA: hypothetical protein ENI64_10630 [Gammaproteobacteria bacterium]|nr:hypothetical protein [Gammaproteobacteria bacterium]
MRWSILVIFLLSLTACGQKGNLYLPEKDAGDKSAQDTPVQDKTARDMASADQFTRIFY